MSGIAQINNHLPTTGVYAGGAATVISGIGLTLIMMYCPTQIPIIACATLGGSGFVTFCISMAKKKSVAKEGENPELNKLQENASQTLLRDVVQDILREFPQYAVTIRNNDDQPFTLTRKLSLKESFELLLIVASKLAEKKGGEEGFQIVASAVTVAGYILLEPHEGEKIQDEIEVNSLRCNPFEILIKTHDEELLKTLFSLLKNQTLINKFFQAICSFGTDEVATLFLETLENNNVDFNIQNEFVHDFAYLGWAKALNCIDLSDILKHDQNSLNEKEEQGRQKKGDLQKNGNVSADERERHRNAQILKGKYLGGVSTVIFNQLRNLREL